MDKTIPRWDIFVLDDVINSKTKFKVILISQDSIKRWNLNLQFSKILCFMILIFDIFEGPQS